MSEIQYVCIQTLCQIRRMIFTPHYLPNITYLSQVIVQQEIRWPANTIYQKQSYRNRAYILGPHQIEKLIIPVHGKSGRSMMKDVKLDLKANSLRQHWKTIENCYKKSAYFEFYAPYFESVYIKNINFLMDLNVRLLEVMLQCLQINLPICLDEVDLNQPFYDLNCKDSSTTYSKTAKESYIQTFGSEFVPNLSALDLLMCTGPEAKSFLDKS